MATNREPLSPRDATINLRLQSSARELIDRAAAAMGKSRAEFMVEAALSEAEAVLLGRCFFALDDKAFSKFAAALDQSPADNPRLRKLLRTPMPWE